VFEIGSSLREARERRGLTLTDAEQRTKIRSRYLAALENERFDLLPGDAYAKGFLRGYADFLGLDGDLYADEYGERFSSPEEPIAVARRPAPRRLPLVALVDRRLLVVAAIVVAVAGLFWLGSGGTDEPTLAPAPRLPRHRPPPPPPPPETPARSRSAEKPPAVLRLVAADGDCWLSVQSVRTGRVLYESTLRQGDGLRFGVRRPLRIRVGAPWNLRATIGGRTVALPSATGDVIASAGGIRTTAPPA